MAFLFFSMFPKQSSFSFLSLESFLSSKVCYLKGIGPVYGKILNTMGLKTFWDMLCFLPHGFALYNASHEDSQGIKTTHKEGHKKQKILVHWIVKIEKTMGEKPWRYRCRVMNPPSMDVLKSWGFDSTIFQNSKDFFCILTFFQKPKIPLKFGSLWDARGLLCFYRGELYISHPKIKATVHEKKDHEDSWSSGSQNIKNHGPEDVKDGASYIQGKYTLPKTLKAEQFQIWIRGIFSLWPQRDTCLLEDLVKPLFFKALHGYLQENSEVAQWVEKNLSHVLKDISGTFSQGVCHGEFIHHQGQKEVHKTCSESPYKDFRFTLHNVFFGLHFGPPEKPFFDVLHLYLGCYEVLAQEISLGLQHHYKTFQNDLHRKETTGALTPPKGPIYNTEEWFLAKKSHFPPNSYVGRILQGFPHDLRPSQRKALHDIGKGLQGPKALCHLLQGDVGTGKSIVAFLLLGLMVDWGYKAILMAPTQTLAHQHFQQLQQWVPVHYVLKNGKNGGSPGAPLLVGTHSLLHCSWEDPQFFQGPLGLLVVDEQQRFGLGQRAQLVAQEALRIFYDEKNQKLSTEEDLKDSWSYKKDSSPREIPLDNKKKSQISKQIIQCSAHGSSLYFQAPVHVVNMSATPIPRTLERVLLGSMTFSTLAHDGPRALRQTSVVSSASLGRIMDLIKNKRDLGQQVYWVCPSIEDNHSVEKRFLALREIFHHDVAMVHGAMTPKEKYKNLEAFYKGEKGILVATTVVEVGLDVPRATIMVVEQAHYFGLSQLHQLRGRVGRGSEDSFCILLSDSRHGTSRQRLSLLKSCDDGFQLSREDWKIRGGGSLFGEEQSGWTYHKFLGPHNAESILPVVHEVATALLEPYTGQEKIFLDKTLSLLLHVFYKPISFGLQGG